MTFLKRYWKKLIKFFGPLLFLFIIFNYIDLGKTTAFFKEIRIEVFVASFIFFPLLNTVKTLRWSIINTHLDLKIPFVTLFSINYSSWFISSLPFGGLFPLAKFFYLKKEGHPAGKSFLSITFEKLFEILGFVIFSLYGFLYFPGNFFGDRMKWFIIGATGIFIFIILLWGKNIWQLLLHLLERYSIKKLSKKGYRIEADLFQLWPVANFGKYVSIISLSVFTGLIRSMALFFLSVSLNLNVPFSFIVACRAIIGIVNIIPISINGLGTRDAILLLSLPLYGVSKEAALALGFLAFLWTVCFKLSGIFFWLRRPIPMKA